MRKTRNIKQLNLQSTKDKSEITIHQLLRHSSGYLEAGNKDLAIENYKKSLLLDPDNKNAEEVLKTLANK